MSRIASLLAWVLALYIVYIFVYYLQYKFTGDAGSVYLFDILTKWLGFPGHEKVMRIGTGSAELIASILLLIAPLQVVGAALALGIMSGAIFFHLVSPLGVDPYHDGGVLFREACTVWVFSLVVLALRRRQGIALLERHLPFVPIPARLRAP